jgi:two-component system NarL family response regulator
VIGVAIVEDHPAIAEGLAALIGSEPDIEITWVAGSERTADELLTTRPPDIVLCDVMLDGRDDGFELLARHGRAVRFILYTAFEFPAHHARALQGGAAGVLSKIASAEEIVAAIRRVDDGGTAFPAHVLQSARQAPRPPTARELDIVSLVVEGLSNDELAARLGLSPKTVEGSLRRLFERYSCDNRTQLARLAMRQGWLTGGRSQPETPA